MIERFVAYISNKMHWLLLVLVEVLALSLTFNESLYHRYVNTVLSNVLTGSINEASEGVRSYMNLRTVNEELLAQNARLEKKYLELLRKMEYAAADTVRPLLLLPDTADTSPHPVFSFLTARVTYASKGYSRNMLTINKGANDGVAINNAVVSAQGVVGIVSKVSSHYAAVVPLTNSQLRLSCKIKTTNYYGNLSWETQDSSEALLVDLPKHATPQVGDTVVTSGYSAVFPANMFVGVVQNTPKSLKGTGKVPVRLGTDFGNLQFVYVITHISQELQNELDSLQKDYYSEAEPL